MAERPDVLKIFLGNLLPDVNKPKLVDMFACWQLYPSDVIVPAEAKGMRFVVFGPAGAGIRLAVAFVVFRTPREAQAALYYCNGLHEPAVSYCNMNAHNNAIVEAFTIVVSKIVFRCCLRGKPLECELLQL